MSSHHFVREDQEPALIIQNAGALPFSKIQELLEWSPTVIVMEHALPAVVGWQIKIDVVVASVASKQRLLGELTDQGPLKWIWSEPDDDEAAIAFHFLAASRQRYANLVGVMTDHLKNLIQGWSDRLHITVFDGEKKWNWITSGRLEKWMPKDSEFLVSHTHEEVKHYAVEQDQLVTIQRPSSFWLIELGS